MRNGTSPYAGEPIKQDESWRMMSAMEDISRLRQELYELRMRVANFERIFEAVHPNYGKIPK